MARVLLNFFLTSLGTVMGVWTGGLRMMGMPVGKVRPCDPTQRKSRAFPGFSSATRVTLRADGGRLPPREPRFGAGERA